MIAPSMAAKVLLAATPAVAVAAIIQAVPDVSWISQVERGGFLAAAIMAAVFLWRNRLEERKEYLAQLKEKDSQLATKDEHLLEMTKQMTQTLTLQVESNREVRAGLAESAKAKSELAKSIELQANAIESLGERIGALSCVVDPKSAPRR